MACTLTRRLPVHPAAHDDFESKSAIPSLLNGSEVLSSASYKAKMFAEDFSKDSNLDDSGISLPLHKNIQLMRECSILVPRLFLLYINDLLDDFICDFAIYADDTTLYCKCDQASNLWQQAELASELESDLQETVDWSKGAC